MNINWSIRFKSKTFWMTIVPAALLLIQAVASVFNITLDLGDIGDKILVVINAIFVVLSILGIVVDPTTKGISDSNRALSYLEPM